MSAAQITALLVLAISPFIGSFLAVLADRLPRGEDAVRPRSACRACGIRLGPRDLIPLVSFLQTKGRCRACGAAIPRWLAAMEIAAMGLAGAAALLGQSPAEIVLYATLLWTLQALVAADLMWFRLPDPLTAALLALALAIAGLTGWPPVSQALWGAAIGAGSFLLIRLGYQALRGREGLGLGDVKLMAGLGAALGPYDIPLMVLIAALSMLAAALATGLAGGRDRAQALSAVRPLPFGAALAAATAILWVLTRPPG